MWSTAEARKRPRTTPDQGSDAEPDAAPLPCPATGVCPKERQILDTMGLSGPWPEGAGGPWGAFGPPQGTPCVPGVDDPVTVSALHSAAALSVVTEVLTTGFALVGCRLNGMLHTPGPPQTLMGPIETPGGPVDPTAPLSTAIPFEGRQRVAWKALAAINGASAQLYLTGLRMRFVQAVESTMKQLQRERAARRLHTTGPSPDTGAGWSGEGNKEGNPHPGADHIDSRCEGLPGGEAGLLGDDLAVDIGEM